MKKITKAVDFIYQRPLAFGVLLSVLTGIYLYADYGVINRSSLNFVWNVTQYQNHSIQQIFSKYGLFAGLISTVSKEFSIQILLSAKILMLLTHAGITYLIIRIAYLLDFAKITRWSLIFLLLAHPTYNDFRTGIIDEPIYWLLWLFALYILMQYYKTHFIVATVVWFIAFLLASTISIVAWMWIFLFPIGILLWPNWRKKPVFYAILAYLILGSVFFFIPIYKDISPYYLFKSMVLDNHLHFIRSLTEQASEWLNEDDWIMISLFVFSGGLSLVILRSILSFGFVCSFLAIYAFKKNQSKAIESQRRQFLIYVIIFDLFSLLCLFVLSVSEDKTIYFTTSFIALLFSALGLSYIIRKIYFNQYPNHISLIIVWCLVAYLASGMIAFGPKKVYLKTAGIYLKDAPLLYSNDATVLFYADRRPIAASEERIEDIVENNKRFTIAYNLNRNNKLPEYLKPFVTEKEFKNNRNDRLIILQKGDVNKLD